MDGLSQAGSSENLAEEHGGDGGKEGDAERGQGMLPLGHRETCDHAGAEAGHGQLREGGWTGFQLGDASA